MNDQRAILNHALRDASVTREVALARSAVSALPGLVRRHLGFAPALVVADGTTHAVVGEEALRRLAAAGAALVDAGFKRTLACSAPVAILADLDGLITAPVTMTGWGYGDLAGKVVAGADWMLADALAVEPIDPGPFSLIQDTLADWLAHPEQLAASEPQAFERLLCGLLVSGLAMQAHGNSRPASGIDHQFAHLWEMEGLAVGGEPAAHGACVGVGCVAMLALHEWLCAQPIDARVVAALDPAPDIAASHDREIVAAFSLNALIQSARVEMAAKRDAGDRRRRLQRLVDAWPSLRRDLTRRLPRALEMQARLRALGTPAHPADLAVELEAFALDHRRARLIRRRYIILDLVDDLGWLDRAIDALFAADSFWGR